MSEEASSLRGKRVTVMGLGLFGGGVAVTKFLVSQGARVLVTDQASPEKLAQSVKQLDGLEVQWRLGGHDQADFTSVDLVVANPAVKPGDAYLAAARSAGVPITTEIGLFAERCRSKRVVGLTGTKGKSTTTAMLGRMLETGLKDGRTFVGGNIGKSLLAELDNITERDAVVLELSSFMLHWLGQTGFRPHIGVMGVILSDHLDWHGSQEEYERAKGELLAHQQAGDFAVVSRAGLGAERYSQVPARTGATLVWYRAEDYKPFSLKLPGEHNQHNAQGAWEAAQLLGVSRDDAEATLAEFSGLPHRLELVGEVAGVQYYNDSIATIAQAAAVALGSFEPGRVIQIVGGFDKGLDLMPMVVALRERAKTVLTIGQMGPWLAEQIGEKAYFVETLERAVAEAAAVGKPGDVVLLSPGCASYGQFANFQERGQRFGGLVQGLGNGGRGI